MLNKKFLILIIVLLLVLSIIALIIFVPWQSIIRYGTKNLVSGNR